MNDLLAFALSAHGGLDRWNVFNSLSATASIDGAIWHIKGQPGMLLDKTFTIETRKEVLTISPFPTPGLQSRCSADRLIFVDDFGRVAGEREHPARGYESPTLETPWDRFDVAYFASEAVWTYLTSPFVYTYPGFATEEIAPWHEGGEVWRRLQVTFPDYIFTHTKTQITYFGPDGLMRRHDYTVDILGGATGANYPTDYLEVQGLMIPTKRRIYAYDQDRRRVPEPLLVSLDFSNLVFA